MLPLPELHVSLRASREDAPNLEPAKGQGIREVERRYLGRHVKADAAALGNRRRELQTHSELFPDDRDGTELSALDDGEGELPSSQEGRLLAREGKQVRLRKTLELSPRLEHVNDPFEIRVGVHKEEPQQSIRDRFDDARIHGWTAAALPYARDRKSTRLNSSHGSISYAVFCLNKQQR